MGKCDTATAYVGMKILLSDLITQINETNFELIKQILNGGFISDHNDNFNDMYAVIMEECDGKKLPENYLEFKSYLEEKFKTHGDYTYYRNGRVSSLYGGCLFDKELLVPLKRIFSTERWGNERYGVNGSSCPIDFDLSVNTERYRDIQNYTIVFIMQQSAA